MTSPFVNRLRMAAAALPRALRQAWEDDGVLSAPPPGVETEMGRLLWTPPRPLILPKARTLVIYAQKAACTNVVIWYLHQIGHQRAARDFNPWPHLYLERVLLYSQFYRNAYKLDLSNFTVVRVVRDPFERCVSGFRHALRYGFADADIARRVGHRNIGERGLSFSTFLDFLEREDMGACDPHFSRQRHPIEDKLAVHHLIDVTREDLFARLNEVEAAVGLPRTNLAASLWIKQLRWHNRPEPVLADADDLYSRPLTREQAKVGPWPRYEALLTPLARERIARLYAVDIESYFQKPPPGTKATGVRPKAPAQPPQPAGVSPRSVLETRS